MNKAKGFIFIDETLEKLYPDPKPPLNFKTHYQLLVAVILSAQCTDARVNIVTKKLFADCPNPEKLYALGVKGLIPYIRSCGYFNAKSKNIISMTSDLLEKYDGEVPGNMSALIQLAGVGEKTAGVMLAQAFRVPAFPVDTHIIRLSHRLGLSQQKDPSKISADLKELFPKDRWIDLHLQIIFHGRQVCIARKPKCGECPLLKVCPEGQKRIKA